MKSKVYFISVNDLDDMEVVKSKLTRLLDESNIFDFLCEDDTVAIKLHFGEEGNTGYVKPEYVRVVANRIAEKRAIPILTDTNTLYRGRRMSQESHIQLAYEHGFTKEIAGAEVFIADGHKGEETEDIRIDQRFIKVAKIASFFHRANAIIGIAHFKGHLLIGFAGTLKNLGMGCASREGKLAQHSDVAPFVKIKNCRGCGECEKVCPSQAITIVNKKSHINNLKCIGCASCIAACPYEAIDVNWESGAGNIQEKMVEYAKAVLMGKEKRAAFINFAVKITKECDCLAKDAPKISPDIGIFASKDPVGIDKASMDLVIRTCSKDIFKKAHPERNGFKQLHYASEIGLGNLDYELIRLA